MKQISINNSSHLKETDCNYKMSDLSSAKRKRPPKLSPITPSQELVESIETSSASPTSNADTCALESSVEVTIGDDQKRILIRPDSLTVTQQLGRGQYGVVERVRHEAGGCEFAIKRVPLRPGEDDRRRLLMDVDILVKGTNCKNIIEFYGALIWEGDLWVIMELMDCSLDKFYKLAHRATANSRNETEPGHIEQSRALDLTNPIPENILGRIAADVLNALSYLYSIKVIHRDIKPSNILINKQGTIKLCDFGISGYLVNSVARTYEAGCRPYMAPERIDPPRDRTGYDIKSDVWSFGITMMEIANGRYPYQQARDFFEQLKRICTDEPPKLPAGRFSHEMEDFIGQCLMKDYNCRPKFDSLENHPFVVRNKFTDISCFTLEILERELSSNTQA